MAGSAGMTSAITKIPAITSTRAAAAYAIARKTGSPEMRRRWWLLATSGAGATRSAVPFPIRSLGRDLEERAPPGGDGFQGGHVILHHGARQLRVVKIRRVLLPIRDDPVQEIDQGRPLRLIGLVHV